MKAIQYKQDRSFGKAVKLFFLGLVLGVLRAIGRGLSFGFVLFLALSTLSFLSRVLNPLGASGKSVNVSQSKAQVGVQTVSVVPVLPGTFGASPSNAEASEHPSKTQSARDTIRESGYFVSAVESFVRSLSRF